MKPKLMYVIGEDSLFCSHFLDRAAAARDAGYDVAVVTRERAHGGRVRAAGIRLLAVDFRSTNLLTGFRSLLRLWRIYRRERPDVLHHVAAPAIFLGTLAARLLRRGPAIVNAPAHVGAESRLGHLEAPVEHVKDSAVRQGTPSPRSSRGEGGGDGEAISCVCGCFPLTPTLTPTLSPRRAGRTVAGLPRQSAAHAQGKIHSLIGAGLRPVVRLTLRIAWRLLLNPRESRVIFDTADAAAWFIDHGAVRPVDAAVIRAAGVDVRKFRPSPPAGGPPVVALAAPMLRDNGIYEFVAAAGLLRDAGVSARFVLVGAPDPDDPASISYAQLRAWHGANGVEWWEWLDDMALIWRDVHIACLPSWRDGLPPTLLEAAACGLPIVAADTAAARKIVKNGDNGLLIPAGNVPALAKALRLLIDDPGLRSRMGQQGRAVAECAFSSAAANAETLAVYRSLLAGRNPRSMTEGCRGGAGDIVPLTERTGGCSPD